MVSWSKYTRKSVRNVSDGERFSHAIYLASARTQSKSLWYTHIVISNSCNDVGQPNYTILDPYQNEIYLSGLAYFNFSL